MSTTTQYQPRDPRRVCDQCGVLWNRSQLHRKGPWIYCWDCDQPGDRIREEEDAAIARTRPFRILPAPNAKPQNWNGPYDWLTEEAAIFNLVLNVAPARNPGGASDAAAAAWGAVYLCDIISQNTRPSAWLASARVKAASLLAYLLTQQYGAPTSSTPTGSPQNPRYGGIPSNPSTTWSTARTFAAGLAFIKGYSALGNPDYLVAADRVATYLRHSQCGDVQATTHTVFPSGGGPYHVGGLASGLVEPTGLQTTSYFLSDTLALQFLVLLSAVRGASAVYGDATSTAFFTSATQATLSTMMSELLTFIETGPLDSTNGVVVSGLSTTSPRATYSPYLSDGSGTGKWNSPATVGGSVVANAVAGAFSRAGADSTVTGVLAWLAAFQANPANATPTTSTPQQTLSAITGTYDPTVAPPTSMTAAAPFEDATGALYDLAALGVLAPVLNTTNPAALRNSRMVVSPCEPYSPVQPDQRFPGPLGRLGFGLQPNSAAGGVATKDVVFAAQFGAVYRYANP